MSAERLRAEPFRLLGDPLRLRLLRVLARERLNVSEITVVVGLAQSGVSRHLRLLREGGFVVETREAGWSWWVLSGEGPPGLGSLWPSVRQRLLENPDEAGDDARLAEVLRAREERIRGWSARPTPEPGRSWAAWARALGHLLPPLSVADLGCGAGSLALEVARWAGRVTAVEPDAGLLALARKAGEDAGARTITWLEAPLDPLPLADASFDVSLLSQVLHLFDDPRPVVREAARIVAPGGRVLVLDLLPHREAWVRERLHHRRLGLEPKEVRAWLEDAGLEPVRTEEAARRRGNPFTVILASATRPRSARDALPEEGRP